MRFENPTHGFALTQYELLETSNGGKTWDARIKMEDHPLSTFESFAFYGFNHMWIMGSQMTEPDEKWYGVIWRTSDLGQNWNKLSNPIAQYLFSAQFCSQNIGWIVGEIRSTNRISDSVILRTINGGQTWTEQKRDHSGKLLRDIAYFNCDEILALRSDGAILETRNSGRNWTQRDINAASSFNRIRIFENEAWVLGSKGIVFKSIDRGVTWERVFIKTTETLTDISMLGKLGWIVGSNGIILSTLNGGNSWNIEKSGTLNALTCLCATNASVWAGGNNSCILRLTLK